MTLDLTHPYYQSFFPDWVKLRDCYVGESQVKRKKQEYLPATQGMILDGMANATQVGYKAYEAYLLRAVWPELFKDAVEAYLGMLHPKPPTIKLPASMEGIRSAQGEDMPTFLRRINEEQLTSGRAGVLVDLPMNPPAGTKPLPYLAFYHAEAIRNWDIGENESTQSQLLYVILDESGYTSNPGNQFAWVSQTRYRVCQLNNGTYEAGLFSAPNGVPSFDPTVMKTPQYMGTSLQKVPFTFINSKDVLAHPDHAPLLGLANNMFAIYRGEADYRQNLFMQGQDTLVIIGGVRKASEDPDAPLRTGAGSRLEVEQGGDAKYIGVNSSGLPEQRQALSLDRQRAEVRAGQLINARVGDKESGDALRTRIGAQTATLRQIALAGAGGLQEALRNAAVWMGENPDEVEVVPNLEFAEFTITGQDLAQMMTAKDTGLPLSYRSIHGVLVDRGLTTKNFDQEVAEVKEEAALRALFRQPEPKPAPVSNVPTGK